MSIINKNLMALYLAAFGGSNAATTTGSVLTAPAINPKCHNS